MCAHSNGVPDQGLLGIGRGCGNSGLLPNPGEAPAMLKRNGTYYVVYGHTCCYCKAGSPVNAYASAHPPFVAYVFATQINC